MLLARSGKEKATKTYFRIANKAFLQHSSYEWIMSDWN